MDQDSIESNYNCLICTQLAKDAVETTCCGQLMCQKCSIDVKNSLHPLCPNCRQDMNVNPSMMARRIISTIKVECRYGCGAKIIHKELANHEQNCPNKPIQCKFCLKNIRCQTLVEHMNENHKKEVFDILYQFTVSPKSEIKSDKSQKSSIKQQQNSELKKVSMMSRLKNSKGKQMRLGTTGKFYCGQKSLIGKCKCCDGFCGPTNGQNCDECMAADLKRLGLQKGYLVNCDGVISERHESGVYFCGRSIKGFIQLDNYCRHNSLCSECTRLNNAIKLGRYSALV